MKVLFVDRVEFLIWLIFQDSRDPVGSLRVAFFGQMKFIGS